MIEVKHLKTLQALRNCGSLAAAAATLHQTQSALSHQFSDLEQRLGFRLFVRKSQPLRFTPQGEILLQLANQVLPQISQALQACNEPQQTRLRIDYESAFNLTEIEDYAIHELGMQKPRSDQLYYISSSDAADTAVVLDQTAAEPLSLADRFGDFLTSIVEYFR